MPDAATQTTAWHDIVLERLKANDVKLVVYVPDRILTPLIKAIHDDPYFIAFSATREDELAFIIDRSIKQAVATLAPVTFILSPLLTGGKTFDK